MHRVRRLILAIVILATSITGGCAVLSPNPIASHQRKYAPELLAATDPQIEIGRPHKVIDTVGWVIGIPSKILLWDRRIDRHKISEPTLVASADYLEANNLPHLKVRMNQYAPWEDFQRLRKNKTVAWPYRYTLGVLSVAGEAILPGRIIGGDHFNPFTQTAHIYSDVPAVALHELAHAKDFARRDYPGTYALAYLFVPLWHETIATRDVFSHLYEREDRAAIAEANRILYPAYGTYVGSSLGNFIPQASVPIYYSAVVLGHINGRWLTRDIDQQIIDYQRERTPARVALEP